MCKIGLWKANKQKATLTQKYLFIVFYAESVLSPTAHPASDGGVWLNTNTHTHTHYIWQTHTHTHTLTCAYELNTHVDKPFCLVHSMSLSKHGFWTLRARENDKSVFHFPLFGHYTQYIRKRAKWRRVYKTFRGCLQSCVLWVVSRIVQTNRCADCWDPELYRFSGLRFGCGWNASKRFGGGWDFQFPLSCCVVVDHMGVWFSSDGFIRGCADGICVIDCRTWS